tara:strand:+ start:2566 stop:3096 length:531 start_codon:yes stop_codon:yes gene_type:complete
MKLLKQCSLDGVTRENEIWKDVKHYEGLYKVSNLGRVKSLRCNKEKLLKGSLSHDGYRQFTLQCVKRKKYNVWQSHFIVAITFLNHVRNGADIVVDHIDHDKTNNRLDNLQLITHRENLTKDKNGGSSKYPGVWWRKDRCKWGAQIHIKGERFYLGMFTCELAAAKAYENKLKQIT